MTQKSGVQEDEVMLLEIGRLSARLIHDFKNQLGGMKLYAAYLKKHFAGNAEAVEIADKISETINEMAHQAALVSKLAQPVALACAAHDLGPLVEQAAREATERVRDGQARLALNLAPRLPLMRLDPQQLQSALAALLTRALQVAQKDGLVNVDLKQQGSLVRLQCADDGVTLTEHQLAEFFAPIAAERINSAALNLAQARRIIEAHGGRVTARAADAGGTVVEVEFPVA